MRYLLLLLSILSFFPLNVWSADLASLQASMDTVWLVTAGSLVFFMQAGFALVEGGMVRAKNSVNVIMKNYVDACFGAIAFWMVGYGLMFGDNFTGWFGESHYLLGNAAHLDYSLLFFQTMFAATAATIASGALAERIEYKAYLVGSVLVTAIIYPIFGSWAWGSLYHGTGWLKEMGFIDFAGSTVVHSIGGWVALAGIIVLGPRLGKFSSEGEIRTIRGHNLPMVALGGFILWLGWFGFNGGSTTVANTSIGLIVLNTHLSGAAGAIGAIVTMTVLRQPILLTNTINASISGLVAITAGCATMEPMFAILTGALAGVLMILVAMLLELLRLDDVVGAVSVHAFGGAWGTLAAGLFYAGDLFNINKIYVQLLGIFAAFVWAMLAALIMYFVINKLMGLRASTMDEQRGLDFTEHAEVGYPEFQKEIIHQTQGDR